MVWSELRKSYFLLNILKTLAVIGSNGLLGSDLVRYFGENFQVTSIHKENYQTHLGKSFDILINANGNSKRFWANKNPQDDFLASTVSVYQSIFDFPSDTYIYISSPDVYEDHASTNSTKENQEIDPRNLKPYGFNKYLAELIVKKYKEKFIILRCSMMLGANLKKGPFYDVAHNNPLFVTSESRLQLITTHALFEIIKSLLAKRTLNVVLNVGGMGTFAFTKINQYFNSNIHVSHDAERQIYEMSVEKIKHLYPTLKTSEDYLKDFLKNYLRH